MWSEGAVASKSRTPIIIREENYRLVGYRRLELRSSVWKTDVLATSTSTSYSATVMIRVPQGKSLLHHLNACAARKEDGTITTPGGANRLATDALT